VGYEEGDGWWRVRMENGVVGRELDLEGAVAGKHESEDEEAEFLGEERE